MKRIIISAVLVLAASSTAHARGDQPNAIDLLSRCGGDCHAYSALYLSQPGRAPIARQIVEICATGNVVSVEQCREAERAVEAHAARESGARRRPR